MVRTKYAAAVVTAAFASAALIGAPTTASADVPAAPVLAVGSQDAQGATSLSSSNEAMANSWRFENGVPTAAETDSQGAALQAVTLPDGAVGWGVDVSRWNGTIDWARAKAAGIDFAILRCGYGRGGIDEQFAANVRGCKENGIRFGVYLYAYSWDAESAAQEGYGTLQLLADAGVTPADLSLPVYYDMENQKDGVPAGVDDNDQYRFITGGPDAFAAIARAYCNVLQANGYRTGVYANLNWWNNYLTDPVFDSWDRWVAQYNYQNDYKGSYSFWQYTSTGTVDGIGGGVDLNYMYSQNYVNVARSNAITIPDGTYYINSELKDTSGVGLSASGTTQLEDAAHAADQKFTFTRQGDGSYTIAGASGELLTVADGVARDGATVRLAVADGSDAQRWFLRDSGAGYYIQSAIGNWVLDVANSSSASGTSIALARPTGGNSQRFAPASATVSIDSDGVYAIQLARDTRYVIGSADASVSNNARAEIGQVSGSDTQMYRLREVGNGIYELVNVSSGRVLESTYGLTANSSPVAQYDANGGSFQHWGILDWGDAYTFLGVKSGKALDVPNGDAFEGNPLSLFELNGSQAQRWVLKYLKSVTEHMDDMALAHKTDLADGTYQIASANGNAALLSTAGASGQEVQLWGKRANREGQLWQVSHDADGYVTFTEANSGLVLGIDGAAGYSGAVVGLHSATGGRGEKWVVRKDGDTYELVSAFGNSLSLDAADGETADGTVVRLLTMNGAKAQRWLFSSSSADGAHAVRVESSSNGSVAANSSKAEEGDRITITVQPNDGYRVTRMMVKDSTGNEVGLDAGKDGNYVFVMPDADVTVSAEFSALTSVKFSDVDYQAWYSQGVDYVSLRGIMTGYAGTDQFGVDKPLTRGEFAALLFKYVAPGIDNQNARNETGMSDVADGMFYTAAANWAVKNHVINGYELPDGSKSFGPNDPVTLEQMTAIIANLKDADVANEDKSVFSKFADTSSISNWSTDAVAWAINQGLISGSVESDGLYIRPTEPIMRQRVATILSNAYNAGVLSYPWKSSQ